MARPVKFGIVMPPIFPPRMQVRMSQIFEWLGFDQIWFPDHISYPDFMPAPDVWSIIAACATHTKRIEFGTSVSDLVAGTFMFSGIVSALYAREKTGKGAQIDISMTDCTFAYLEQALMHYVATGEAPPRIGNRHPIMTPFDTFEAADGQFVIAAGNDHLFRQLCQAIGRPELAGDNRFLTNPDRLRNEAVLKRELERTLKTAPKDHWQKVIHAAGVPVAPILDVKQAAEHPQIAARNMLIEAGGVRMPGNPVKISGYEDPKIRVGAPTLDEHGAALRQVFAPEAAEAA